MILYCTNTSNCGYINLRVTFFQHYSKTRANNAKTDVKTFYFKRTIKFINTILRLSRKERKERRFNVLWSLNCLDQKKGARGGIIMLLRCRATRMLSQSVQLDQCSAVYLVNIKVSPLSLYQMRWKFCNYKKKKTVTGAFCSWWDWWCWKEETSIYIWVNLVIKSKQTRLKTFVSSFFFFF